MPSTRSRAVERALEKRLGLAIAALGLIQRGQIVHAGKRIGMLLAEHPLAGLQRAPVERLGLAVAALGLIQARQIVHACKRIGMLLAQHPLAGLERALKSGSASP